MNGVFSDSVITQCRQDVLKKLKSKFKNCQTADIEDAIENAIFKYIQAIKNNDRIERFDSIGKFESWLYIVTENEIIDIMRKNKKFINYEDEKETDNDEQLFQTCGEFIDDKIPFIEFITEKQDEYNIDNILKNFWKLVTSKGNLDLEEMIILQKHHIEGIDLKTLAGEMRKTPNSMYLKNIRLKEKIKEILKKKNIKNIEDLDY
ncbi:MAG TPA: sigma-70 family RNA polymerase sigma factor [Candidatus Kapabacteria bacterium]|nr:sigma-70 family RNA polymerase sigma factor [Candidatus Kapabacteria bacterium]